MSAEPVPTVPKSTGEKTLDQICPEEPGTAEGALKAFQVIVNEMPFDPFEAAKRVSGAY